MQPLKQVAEPCAFLAVPIDFRPGEFSGELLHQCVQLLRLHAGKAAPVPDRAQHIFQQIVEEGPDFRRLEPGGFSLLSPQTILHEIAEMTAFHAIHPGRGHLHLGSVQGTHRLRRQPSPLHLLRPGDGLQHPTVFSVPPEIFRQSAARIASGDFQSRGRHTETVRAILLLHRHLGQKPPDTLHHEGRAQGAPLQ